MRMLGITNTHTHRDAARIAPALSADAALILEAIDAVGGLQATRGVPRCIFDELLAARCITASKANGYDATPLGVVVARIARRKSA